MKTKLCFFWIPEYLFPHSFKQLFRGKPRIAHNMGIVLAKMTACVPIGSATGIVPQEFVEETMEELVSSYDSKIRFCDDNYRNYMNEAVALRRRGNNKAAIAKLKNAKMEERKRDIYEKQRDNIQGQLEMSTDRRLTIQTVKVMGEHRNLMTKEFGTQAVEEAEELMMAMREQQGDMDRVQDVLAQPIADTTDVDYECFDEGALMAELDAIAFEHKGENIEYPSSIHTQGYISGGGDGSYQRDPYTKTSSKHSAHKGEVPTDRRKSTSQPRQPQKSKKKMARAVNHRGREETLTDILGK